jgi:cysteine-rich repeat protein
MRLGFFGVCALVICLSWTSTRAIAWEALCSAPEMFTCETAEDCIVIDGMGPCCCQNGGRNYAVNRAALAGRPFCAYCGYAICATVYNCADYGVACREGRCELARCGDGHLDDGEECDDGNGTAGDGCGRECLRELCGRAAAGLRAGPTISSSDALLVLRVATGLTSAPCPACVCDLDASGDVTAADALHVLTAAVGTGAAESCPPCDVPLTSG